jgi:hypothetical protein
MSTFTRTSPNNTPHSSHAGPTLQGPRRATAWLGLAVCGLALCAGSFWVGAQWLKPMWLATQRNEANPNPAQVQMAFVPTAASPRATPRPVNPVATAHAALVLDGREVAQPGDRVALTTGARFQVALHAQRSGMVRIEAVNPQGITSVVWTTHMQAGDRSLSPMLRLAGTRGMEHLRVVTGSGHVQRFAILH